MPCCVLSALVSTPAQCLLLAVPTHQSVCSQCCTPVTVHSTQPLYTAQHCAHYRAHYRAHCAPSSVRVAERNIMRTRIQNRLSACCRSVPHTRTHTCTYTHACTHTHSRTPTHTRMHGTEPCQRLLEIVAACRSVIMRHRQRPPLACRTARYKLSSLAGLAESRR